MPTYIQIGLNPLPPFGGDGLFCFFIIRLDCELHFFSCSNKQPKSKVAQKP
ncbi:hypothetical protein PORCRE_52 [Porphyromonas crevioricanis JCM 15906]|uniref:Uncharacterized protein n=1 Tax=Porphyromonas crevioricanis JCM 15906 TaxID=1305617 RepID=S4N6J5_9PORP|nr:hypothetical protein PORCRE_52 [Porphyromonas crevioricanis JCM 15906]GAD07791.1 hypothetical protein PORCAN_1419 [Porphyromonas crevioricanis JCM 13913]